MQVKGDVFLPSQTTNQLGSMSVGKLLAKLAAPAILAQLINALYNIVDRIYIGNMEEVGYLALTGVGLTFPIITLISAFAALIGIGGAPLMSISLGEKDEKRAHRILGNCVSVLLMMSVVLTVFFSLFKVPLLYLFGASDNTIGYADDYITIYLYGTVFVMIALGLNNFVNAQGFSRTSMLTVLIGAVCNIVLDPVFIFVFDLGVKGAAIATILSQALSAGWVLLFLCSKKATVRIRLQDLRLKGKTVLHIMSLGVSPFAMQSTESLVMIALNSQLQHYGNDYYVGAMTIISSLMQLLLMPVFGMMQGAQPIISYNYGAGQLDRVRRAFHLAFRSCLGYTTAMWILIMLFPKVFISIFNQQPELVETAVWALRVHMAMLFMLGIQNSCQQTFLALGQAKISLFLALLRKVLLLIPFSFLFPLFFGVKGIYFAEPIADFLASVTTGMMFLLYYKKHLKKTVPNS